MASKVWMENCRKPDPSDVSDEEWLLIVPYLALRREDAGQREHSLRAVFHGLRYIVKTGAPRRWMPNDPPKPSLACTSSPLQLLWQDRSKPLSQVHGSLYCISACEIIFESGRAGQRQREQVGMVEQ